MSELIEKCREFGKKRIEIAASLKTPEDWQTKWPANENEFIYKLGPCWTHMIEYYVDDFEAEVGFMTDILGFDTFVADGNMGYCSVTNPDKFFYFSFYKADGKEKIATPGNAIKLCLMVENIEEVTEALEKREIEFERKPAPDMEGSPMLRGIFKTPNGIRLELWGMMSQG